MISFREIYVFIKQMSSFVILITEKFYCLLTLYYCTLHKTFLFILNSWFWKLRSFKQKFFTFTTLLYLYICFSTFLIRSPISFTTVYHSTYTYLSCPLPFVTRLYLFICVCVSVRRVCIWNGKERILVHWRFRF